MSYPVLTALPVGQGNGYLLEVYDKDQNDKDRKLTYLALVDFGSISRDSFDSAHRKYSREYVWEKMCERYQNLSDEDKPKFNDHYLDTFLLTHQDTDHWNEFDKLLAQKCINKFKKGDREYVLEEVKDGNYKEILTFEKYKIENKNKYKITANRYYDDNNENIVITMTYKYNNDSKFDCEIYINLQKGDEYNFIINYIEPNKLNIKLKKVDEYNSIINHIEPNQLNTIYNIVCTYDDNTYCIKIVNYNYRVKCDFPSSCKNENSKVQTIIEQTIIQLKKTIKTPLCNEFKIVDPLMELLMPCVNKNKLNAIIDYDVEKIKKKFNNIKTKKPVIRNSFCGGIDYSASASSFKSLLKTCSQNDCQEIVKKKSTENKETIILSNKDITINVLCCLNDFDNSLHFNGNELNKRNASSAVTLWDFGNNCRFLFTGDATAHTMLEINKKNNFANYEKAIMTAPHHGSDHTSRGRETTDETNDEYNILKEFLQNLAPAAIEISSGHESQFFHPGENFIMKCWQQFFSNKKEADSHWVYHYAVTSATPATEKKSIKRKFIKDDGSKIKIVNQELNKQDEEVSMDHKTGFCFFKCKRPLYTNVTSVTSIKDQNPGNTEINYAYCSHSLYWKDGKVSVNTVSDRYNS